MKIIKIQLVNMDQNKNLIPLNELSSKNKNVDKKIKINRRKESGNINEKKKK